MYSDIYKREIKVQTENWKKKKKKKGLTKMVLYMNNSEKCCMNNAKILQKKEHKSMTGKKKSDEQYILNIPASVTKYLFSVVVSRSFIFYHFILTYKKLTPQ